MQVVTVLVLTGEAGRDGKYNDPPDVVSADLLTSVTQILDGR